MAKVGEVVGVLLVGMLIMVVFSGPLGTGPGGSTAADQDTVDIVGGSETISTGGATLENVSRVRTSLNDSVQLTGAPDSNVTLDTGAALDDTWSVCTYASADSSVVTGDETRLAITSQAASLQYNGSTDEWQGHYLNTTSLDSYRASVAATSPTTPTLVCLNHDGSSLNVSANTTTGGSVATGSANDAPLLNGSSWAGSLEETRRYETPLNGSQRTEWVADPVLAVAGPAPADRVTYDTRAGSAPASFDVYFASGSATAANATLATGRAGPSVTDGVDYSISGDTISVLGGQLDPSGEVLYLDLNISEGGLGVELARLSLVLMVLVGLSVAISRRL